MNRRELLQKFGGALALNGLSLSAMSTMSTMSTMSRMAMANPNSSESPNIADPEQYFVFVVFSGAWDPMLALDPRDPTLFSDSVIPETQIQTGYDLLDIGSDPRIQTPNMTFGPYIGNLAAMSDKVVLVRGMSMSSVGHSSATKHALTARVPSGDSVRGSSVSTVLSSLLGAENEIANLVVGTDSYNLGHPVWSSGFQSSNVDDFHAALSEGAVSLSEPQNDALYQFFERERRNNTIGRFDTMYANRESAQLLLQSGTSALFDLDSPDLGDLKQYFGVGNGITGSESENALMAYQALTNGVSRCVTYKAAGGLDSHNGDDWQTQHGPRLQNGFNSVASLASLLENTPHPSGGNWLSRTTIWCMSEFQRNPLLNNNFGRDHYITNSALLLGGGLVGGRVIGATSDQKMKSQKVDLATGEVDNDNGVYISHEHIARTLLYRLGVEEDLGDYREPPISALL